MENVPRETNKSKWLIALFALFLLIIPFGSASANGTEIKSDNWYYFDSGAENQYHYAVNTTGYLYMTPANGLYASDYYYLWELNDDGSIKNNYGGFANSFNIASNLISFVSSNADVYNDIQKSSIFFSKPVEPPKPVAMVSGVEELPETIVANLRGGLLGLGLTILAIMLGVSLIPRLIHYFNR